MARSKLVTLKFKDDSERKVDAKQADRMVKMFPQNWTIIDDPRESKSKEKRVDKE